MALSVDRLEGDLVVLCDEKKRGLVVSKSCFDEEPREGDCVVERYGRYSRSARSTQQLRDEVNSLLDKLLNK